jgi:hypothetical protein
MENQPAESDEKRFLTILSRAESNDTPTAWGDHEYAVGRYQDHPSYYATWGPKPADFGGVERSWDWCFTFAATAFFRAARRQRPTARLDEIAMIRHLHGQLRWSGWDAVYYNHWCETEHAIYGQLSA